MRTKVTGRWDMIWNENLIWNVLVCLVFVQYIVYISLQSFITCVQMHTGCQIIPINFLLIVSHKQTAITKLFPLPYLLPDLYCHHYSVYHIVININMRNMGKIVHCRKKLLLWNTLSSNQTRGPRNISDEHIFNHFYILLCMIILIRMVQLYLHTWKQQ